MLTFGYELEFLGANIKKISKKYKIPYYKYEKRVEYNHFHLKPEISIETLSGGGELISPIYRSKEFLLQEMKEKLEILKSEGAYIPKNSDQVGFHIHINKDILKSKKEYYEVLLKILFAFQPEIKELAKGNHEVIRCNFDVHSAFLEKRDIIDFLSIFPYLDFYINKMNSIHFTADTFELRYFNSSLEELVLKRYLDFAWSLADYIIKKHWDMELIDFYFFNSNSNPTERKSDFCRILNVEL